MHEISDVYDEGIRFYCDKCGKSKESHSSKKKHVIRHNTKCNK